MIFLNKKNYIITIVTKFIYQS